MLGSLSKGHPEDPQIKEAILKGYEMLGLEALIVVGGDGSLDIIYDLAQRLKEYTQNCCHDGQEVIGGLFHGDFRVTVLGHLQRSHTPVASDRILATVFGIKAIELIAEKRYNRIVIWREGQVHSAPLSSIIKIIKKCHQENNCTYPVDSNGFMVKTARSLGIYLGEN